MESNNSLIKILIGLCNSIQEIDVSEKYGEDSQAYKDGFVDGAFNYLKAMLDIMELEGEEDA